MGKFLKKFVESLEEIFKDDLMCVLLLGSVQKDDTTPFSDIDLVAIVRQYRLEELRAVRNLLRQSERLLDLSFLYWDEIPTDPNQFVIGTHGCYQLALILNKAKCLYGHNILLRLSMPTEENIRQSLIHKITQYTWWARRMFVESNRSRTIETNYQINSRLIKMIRGLLYISENFDIHSRANVVISRFIKKYSHILTLNEKILLKNLVDKSCLGENSANLSEEYLCLRISIINKIHKEAMNILIAN